MQRTFGRKRRLADAAWTEAACAVQPVEETPPDEGQNGDDALATAEAEPHSASTLWRKLLDGHAAPPAGAPAVRCKAGARMEAGRQLQLTLSDSNHASQQKRCVACGMVYTRGLDTDEQLHAKHHAATVTAVTSLTFRTDAEEVVVERGVGVDGRPWRIVRMQLPRDLSRAHTTTSRKLLRMSKALELELGCEPFAEQAAGGAALVAFARVGASDRVHGCLVAERIGHAYELLVPEPPPPEHEAGRSGAAQAPQAQQLTAARAGAHLRDAAAKGSLQCSSVRVHAECGVRYVWVAAGHRRKGVGRSLLDACRSHLVSGICISRERLAFSQPTADGLALAMAYTRTPRFPVYIPTAAECITGR